MSEYKVGVYDEDIKIGEVEYNQNLDYWDGSNWCHGRNDRHLGVAKWKNGRYVIIHGDDLEGHRDWAQETSRKEAYKLIKEFKPELFEEEEFEELLEYDSILEDERWIKLNREIEECKALVEEAETLPTENHRRRRLAGLFDDRRELWRKL